jgi:hypothetical protein
MRISILFCIGLLTCMAETHASPEHLPLAKDILTLAKAADNVKGGKQQSGVKAPADVSAAQLERTREQGRLLDEQILQLKQELLDLEKQKLQMLKLPQCPPLKQGGPEIQQAL